MVPMITALSLDAEACTPALYRPATRRDSYDTSDIALAAPVSDEVSALFLWRAQEQLETSHLPCASASN